MKEADYFEVKAEIVSYKKETSKIYSCIVRSEQISSAAKPGQFINIQICSALEKTPVLRRPFAISHIDRDCFEFIFDIVGRGTEILKKAVKTEKTLNILGPLGNGFDISSNVKEKLLIAGGVGIAPLKSLVQYFSNKDCNTTLIWGNRSKTHFFNLDFFIDQNLKLFIATDDGSTGFEGNVLQLLKSEINNKNLKDLKKYDIFVVGPDPMMKAISGYIQQMNSRCQVSLETPMACGMGVCQGCAVKKKNGDGYYLVCKDGPVFYSDTICFN
jgi:dihydroorotate dehydrogenase electron transfer subunit